jgi:hypothetical protein
MLIGAFSLITLGANDQALDIVKQYISLWMGSLSEKITIL